MSLQLLTTEQICTIFGVTDRTLYNWRKSKKKPFPEPTIKGFPNRWKQELVEDFINSPTANAA